MSQHPFQEGDRVQSIRFTGCATIIYIEDNEAIVWLDIQNRTKLLEDSILLDAFPLRSLKPAHWIDERFSALQMRARGIPTVSPS